MRLCFEDVTNCGISSVEYGTQRVYVGSSVPPSELGCLLATEYSLFRISTV
jgi:hypothetical protein